MSCSELSREAGVPLAGTTTIADRWLLVEHDGPWGRDAVPDSGLPEPAAEALLGFDGRVLLVRRPGRSAASRPAVFAARTTEDGGELRRIDLSRIEDVAATDLETAGAPIEGPLVLVCTHRKRDACCARLGVPVYNALRQLVPAGLLWRSSHQGGHRFAANVLALPHGIQLGRVGRSEAAVVAAALAAGRIPLAHYRGRSLHAPEVQAADALVRNAEGLDRVGDVRLVEHEGDRVVLATPRSVVEVRVEERPGPTLPASCGAEAEPTTSLVATIVGRTA